jgi:deferrochelatase/peroxidase EfeB
VSPDDAARRSGTSRRLFLGGALGTASLVAAGGAGFGIAHADDSDGKSSGSDVVPFYGAHQAGIATPAQDRVAFAAFDLTSTDKTQLQTLLARWSAAAAQMTKGQPIGAVDTAPQAPPIDTGEALGLGASELTVTVGFGPKFFDERFGFADRRPAALADIPALPGDALIADISNGDLCVQACANDPQVAFHVIRNFARLARGTAVMRWSQLGFGRTSSTSTDQATPRNLLGFKDGTRNIKGEDTIDLDRFVWVGDETDQPWMKGGSYVVTRRIRMLLESWDTDYLADQERVIGRFKTSGAPLTGTHEFDVPLLNEKDSDGQLVINERAHIHLAAPTTNGEMKILRRGYSFTDGIDTTTGLLDAGLFFIAYQKDPRKQFVPIQERLGSQDLLNEYIQHTSSALFAVPPGLGEAGDYYGKSLFE